MKRGEILQALAFKNSFKKIKKDYYIYFYLLVTVILTITSGKDILLLGNVVLLGGIVSFAFLKNEKILLLFTILVSLIYEGIPSFGTYIVMYMYVMMLISLLTRKEKISIDRTILIVGGISLLLSVAPLLANGISIPLLLFSVLKRFGFLIVYIFTINIRSLNNKFKKMIMKFIIVILIINFLFALVQFEQGILTQDFITGFFGGGMTGIVMYLFMLYISILSGAHYQKKLSTLLYLILTLIPVVYAAIAEVKIGFITTGVLLIIYLLIINRSYKSFLYLIICVFVFLNLYTLFVKIYPAHDFLNEEFLETYLVEQNYGDEGSVNRFGFKSQIDEIIFSNNTEVLFGKGLGSGNPSEMEMLKGDLYNQYDYLKFRWFTIPYLYVETGSVGTTLYILIYLIPLISAIRYFWKKKTALSVTLILMGLTNMLYLPYNSGVFHYGITTVYWIYVGLLVCEKKNLK